MKRTRELKHRLERNWDRGMDERLRAVHQTFSSGDVFIVFGFGVLLVALFAMLGILIWG